ncbi:MAG: hypothetical protein C5B57_10530 [Blastocatellia bacterium]|nr:MAG: hypothetical protein C5B57_10530 [Blastocatellia bacterium]
MAAQVGRMSRCDGLINVNMLDMREMWPQFADMKKLGENVESLEGRCSIQLSYRHFDDPREHDLASGDGRHRFKTAVNRG